MSVRPITVSEETHAYGHPFVNSFAVMGGLQGVLIYLHRSRIPVQSNWFPNSGSFKFFAFLSVGGYLTGGLLALAFYSDSNLIRLAQSHKKDLANNIEAQNVRSFASQ